MSTRPHELIPWTLPDSSLICPCTPQSDMFAMNCFLFHSLSTLPIPERWDLARLGDPSSGISVVFGHGIGEGIVAMGVVGSAAAATGVVTPAESDEDEWSQTVIVDSHEVKGKDEMLLNVYARKLERKRASLYILSSSKQASVEFNVLESCDGNCLHSAALCIESRIPSKDLIGNGSSKSGVTPVSGWRSSEGRAQAELQTPVRALNALLL